MGQLFETEKKPLTETDTLRLGAELAGTAGELIELKEEKSNVSRSYRVRIRELEEKVEALSRQLNDGVVEKKFEVEEVPDDSRKMIQILRKDTREQLTVRPMNEAEKEASRKRQQADLPFDGESESNGDGALAGPGPGPRRGKGAKASAAPKGKAKARSTNGKRA